VTVVEIVLRAEVTDWLASLGDADQKRATHAFDRLASFGHTARMPHSPSLGDGLFELRFSLGPTARRITYRFTEDHRIVLLTTFRKQRNNERAEIERARQVATLDEKEEHDG
jgi:putative component of toxin-antitoxin plasmid stabilization module